MALTVAELAATLDVDDKGLDGKLGMLAGKFGPIGTAAVAAAAVAAAALAGLAIAAVKLGGEFDKAYDTIRVGTGATGEVLDGLKADFKEVVKSVPADFADAGTAVADLNTRLGITGKPLQDLSAQFLDLARITGTEVGVNIDTATRAFGDWNIASDKQSEALDRMFRASQNSGVAVDKLGGQIVQFGAPLRNLGFGFDTSLALLAQFNKTGVNTEAVMAGLKIGIGTMAKAGEDAPETFKRVVSEIEKLGPGAESTGKAIELFGQRAGPDLADAIHGGKFDIDAMYEAIANGEDTITKAADDTESWGEKLKMLKNRALVGIEPLLTGAFTALGSFMDLIAAAASSGAARALVDALGAAFEWLKGIALEIWPYIAGLIDEAILTVKSILRSLKPVIDWMGRQWAAHGDTVKAALAVIKSIISSVLKAVFNVIRAVLAIIRGDWSSAWVFMRNSAQHAFNAIGAAVKAGLSLIRALLSGLAGKIKGWIGNLGSTLWNAGANLIQGLIDGIESKLSWLRSKLSSVTSMIPEWKGPLDKDRVLLRPAGQAIMDGLMSGIASRESALGTQLAGITAGIAGAPALAGAGGRQIYIAPGAVQVTVSGSGLSRQQATDAVRAGVEPGLERLAREIKAL